MASIDSAEKLVKAALRLSNVEDFKTVTEIITETARELVGSDGATFVLKENDLCYYLDENAISPLWAGKKFPMAACISGWSMTHRRSVIIPDIYKDARIPVDAYKPTFVKSLCMVPIRKDSPIGAIGNYWKNITHPSFEDLELMQVLADIASNAIENIDLKKSLKATTDHTESLINRNQELDAYVHSLAHDLKSPLTSLLGLADLMYASLDVNNPEKTKNYAQSLKECAKNLHLQIEKILGLYRFSNEKIQPKVVNLQQIAKEVVDSLMVQYPKKEVSVELETNMTAHGDPILLRIVMENLINNSFKFSNKGARLKIKVGKTPNKENYETFFVQDNGIGIKEGDENKLFRPLGRVHNESEYPGLGLGLYSVSQIIKLHGGTVRAESSEEEGAIFYFTLPAV